MNDQIKIRKDLQDVLESTGGLAPRYMDGELCNPTPCMSHVQTVILGRVLQGFNPQTESELQYWSGLFDICNRGGYSDTVEENTRVRRLEYGIYLGLGFSAGELSKFYKDVNQDGGL